MTENETQLQQEEVEIYDWLEEGLGEVFERELVVKIDKGVIVELSWFNQDPK